MTLAFEQVEQRNAPAADVLVVCAFLAPEAIPETFFLEGATQLGSSFEALAASPLHFQQAMKTLLAYSLIQREPVTRTIVVHRLVQMALTGCLSHTVSASRVARVIAALAHLLPSDRMQANYWHTWRQLLCYL